MQTRKPTQKMEEMKLTSFKNANVPKIAWSWAYNFHSMCLVILKNATFLKTTCAAT